MAFKSGFVAVVGRPNVGKSSLINALVGEKVSITGPKAQTTRNKIYGIKSGEDYQIVYVDTPGTVKPATLLGEYMSTVITKASQDVDALVIVLDATRLNAEDEALVKKYESAKFPVFVAINKLDLISLDKLYPMLKKFNSFSYVKSFVSVSAKTNKNVAILEREILNVLPDGVAMFPSDIYTDKSSKFIASEVVREKSLLFLQEEIPHGIAVEIVKFEEEDGVTRIFADIICEKQNHKQIIIGKKAETLKKIGKSSRIELEKILGTKIYLELFVKVKPGWKNSEYDLKSLGYDKKDV